MEQKKKQQLQLFYLFRFLFVENCTIVFPFCTREKKMQNETGNTIVQIILHEILMKNPLFYSDST